MSRVLLLFGGKSSEHEVSCASAVSIHDALEASGHRVVPVGIARDGAWYLADTSIRPFRAEGRSVTFEVPSGSLRLGDDRLECDVVFPVLHGPHGEDGTVQGMCEVAGLPYVGCGVLGSALAMDKDLTKQVVSAAGIATSPWKTVHRDTWSSDPTPIVDGIADALTMPVFVKPSAQGSSIGVARVDDFRDLKDAIANGLRYDDKVIVEQGVEGREIEVAVLDGPAASVPGEVLIAGEWYTYEAKYADDTSEFQTPADLSPEASARVQALAEQVFTTLGLEGLARIDFFYEVATGRFVFNEANTMPGFTSISGFPKMWIASGMSYPELCDHLVTVAVERHASRGRRAIR